MYSCGRKGETLVAGSLAKPSRAPEMRVFSVPLLPLMRTPHNILRTIGMLYGTIAMNFLQGLKSLKGIDVCKWRKCRRNAPMQVVECLMPIALYRRAGLDHYSQYFQGPKRVDPIA